ncbi:MAG TPA: geranylgeranylglyceryl/heptaprenylglyceryl phosphate synthase [Salinivirgaceae bacterium]|nr:geranylgeranylglyceryl/heptaprenylglyceryl phosphate synthase [Salinivirgaceae bacterium]
MANLSSKHLVFQRLFNNNRNLVVLIDPDKFGEVHINLFKNQSICEKLSAVFLGGSLIFNQIDTIAKKIKQLTDLPLILFPGSVIQLTPHVDAILFLSLISGRNPEYLIGHHVIAAPQIKRMGIETIPTGYMLFENGTTCSVTYMSGTMPLPRSKTDLAIATAIAGEMLGLKALYLEAGSGARSPIPLETLQLIRKNVSIPIIVGGGVKNRQEADALFDAGANVIVLGSIIEEKGEFFFEE